MGCKCVYYRKRAQQPIARIAGAYFAPLTAICALARMSCGPQIYRSRAAKEKRNAPSRTVRDLLDNGTVSSVFVTRFPHENYSAASDHPQSSKGPAVHLSFVGDGVKCHVDMNKLPSPRAGGWVVGGVAKRPSQRLRKLREQVVINRRAGPTAESKVRAIPSADEKRSKGVL